MHNAETTLVASDIITSVILAEAYTGSQIKAQKSWLDVRDQIHTPIVFSTQNSRILCMVFDCIIADSKKFTGDNITELMGRTSAHEIRNSIKALETMDKESSLEKLTKSQIAIIKGKWRNPVGEEGSALDMFGGWEAVGKATGVSRSELNGLSDLISTVLDDFRRKKTIAIMGMCASRLESPYENCDEAIEQAVNSLLNKTVQVNDYCDADNFGKKLIERDAVQNQLGGIWGIPALDAQVPLRKGNVITLAAAQGGGKTSLGIQIARESKLAGSAVLYISLEMTRDQLMARMYKQVCGVSEVSIMDGVYLDNLDRKAASGAAMAVSEGERMSIRDGTSYTTATLNRVIKTETLARDLDLVIIDHYHRLRPAHSRQNEYEHLSDAAIKLADMAKEYGVCILNMAQFSKANQSAGHNDDGTTKATKRPQLSDLRGASSLADNTAAAVLLWVRTQKESRREVTACIEKNRFGSLSDIDLSFNPSNYGIFEECEHTQIEKNEW